ncbi:hypothetical protein [Paraburkholderia sp. HP33-1]|uniref:hypothetical protein n=1 Tax=Paraburkholderia sp. HP33-1 TaxID=2883243 RepID=UPI001F265F38|nr:hypothetical protein [Paraburkholderia sp. HP33-1]
MISPFAPLIRTTTDEHAGQRRQRCRNEREPTDGGKVAHANAENQGQKPETDSVAGCRPREIDKVQRIDLCVLECAALRRRVDVEVTLTLFSRDVLFNQNELFLRTPFPVRRAIIKAKEAQHTQSAGRQSQQQE